MATKTKRSRNTRRAAAPSLKSEELVFAVTSVNGSSAACATHGDAAFVRAIESYYDLADKIARATPGARIVKTLGDGFLMTFPATRAVQAIVMLRRLQVEGTAHWKSFDPACAVTVRVGHGSLVTGTFGPSGLKRYDVFGGSLNRLFKLPNGDFVVTPELRQLLGADRPGMADTLF